MRRTTNKPPPRLAASLLIAAFIGFGSIHVYWGLGFRPGLTTFLAYDGEREADMISSPWFRALGLWGVALLSAVAAGTALIVRCGWDGEAVPRPIVLACSAGAAGVLLARGTYGLLSSPLRAIGQVAIPDNVDPNWFWLDSLLLAPGFVLAGYGFAVLAWDQWRRIRMKRNKRG